MHAGSLPPLEGIDGLALAPRSLEKAMFLVGEPLLLSPVT